MLESTCLMNSSLYEKYHNKRSVQNRVVNNNNFTYYNTLKILATCLSEKKGNALDIGCGTGTLSFYLASKGYIVSGIDISKKAIEACKKNAKQLGFEKETRFEKMEFPSYTPKGKFNLVICSEIIEHIKDDEKALRKIYNLLTPKGILLLSTPSENAPLYKLGLLKKFDTEVGHLRRYTEESLIKKIKKLGFEIIDTHKTEGILRNLLFTNNIVGQFVRFINKFNLSLPVTIADNFSLKLFGESQIFVVAQK